MDFLIQNTLHWVTDYVLGEHILSRGASEHISIYTTNAIWSRFVTTAENGLSHLPR